MLNWNDIIEQAERRDAEIEQLLKQYGELLGQDLSAHHVYGSPMRPMSASWARIEDAVFMQSDAMKTGYHTFIAMPLALSQETLDRYELVAIDRS